MRTRERREREEEIMAHTDIDNVATALADEEAPAIEKPEKPKRAPRKKAAPKEVPAESPMPKVLPSRPLRRPKRSPRSDPPLPRSSQATAEPPVEAAAAEEPKAVEGCLHRKAPAAAEKPATAATSASEPTPAVVTENGKVRIVQQPAAETLDIRDAEGDQAPGSDEARQGAREWRMPRGCGSRI